MLFFHIIMIIAAVLTGLIIVIEEFYFSVKTSSRSFFQGFCLGIDFTLVLYHIKEIIDIL